ncbi:MAG: alpha-amylase family protein [Micropruina sp.]|uniref:alpha-amylase family protein n=1 Tax=Micropruina sp. TaxID=2737536 RepID=UPI0039E43CA3
MERNEPGWVQYAIWWRLYPLGFVGAFPPGEHPARPDEHRLRRIIGWLDHVAELGASGIALGPIFAAEGHGYDTLDHFRLDPRLGEQADFDDLVAEAHRRGLRVQLDGVFNHVGRNHPLVQAALREGRDGEASRWFRVVGDAADRVELATFEGHEQLVALNHDNPDVQAWVVDIMRHWLDRGADAWRLDAAYAVPRSFWASVLPQVRATHPAVWFEAEVLHGDYAGFVRDSTVDTTTQYELWKAIWSSIDDRNFYELDWALRRHNAMLADFVPATFIGNHDVTRIASRIADPRHLPHAVLLLAMLGGTPTVYAGDEYAFRAVKEERVGGDDAIRPEFPPGGPADLSAADPAIYRLHQQLIGLRRRHPWLHRAVSSTLQLANEQYLLRVEHGADHLDLALNLADRPLPIDQQAPIVAADPETGRGGGRVAPHGWAVLAGQR